MGRTWKDIVGIQEVRSKQLWKAVFAEAFGTCLLVPLACGAGIIGWGDDYKPSILHLSICAGLTIALIVQIICHVSGGNIDPAVTFGVLLMGKCSIVHFVLYVFFQCFGATIGAAILKGLTPYAQQETLGTTNVSEKLTLGQAFGVEFFITFVLVFTVFSVIDENRLDVKGSAPIVIGIAVLVGHLMAMKYTGASMNPARSFGPALVSGHWTDHWVYWVGPMLGGGAAGIVYEHIFSAPPPDPEVLEKAKLHSLAQLPESSAATDKTTSV